MTLGKLDIAFGWDPGSAAKALRGGEVSVSGELRGRSGQVISGFTAIEGGEQEDLEMLRLATIIMDARDLVRSQKGPLMTALTLMLDEAADLVVRIRAGEDGDIENARWFINELRAGDTTIRRQGNRYVVENKGEIAVTDLTLNRPTPAWPAAAREEDDPKTDDE